MKSIFDLENRLDINNEFEKLVRELYEDRNAALYAEDKYRPKEYSTLIEAIDKMIFLKWKYRDTFIDVDEYLEHIGVDYERTLIYGAAPIDKINFLYFLEFLANMWVLIKKEDSIELSQRAIAVMKNIHKILEKMNYKLKELEDKVVIVKRDSDVDSVLTLVPVDIANILLEYNDFRIQNDIEAKKKILKDIDLYIEKHKEIKEQTDSELYNSIGMVVNKMGVNHPIKEEPFKSFKEKQLIEWYDKCFLMMIHAIRTVEVNKTKQERKELLNNN